MNPEKNTILAFEHFGVQLGKDLYSQDLESAEQIEMLFDLAQILQAVITGAGWKYLFEKVGIRALYEIDVKSGWLNTDDEKDWIESLYYNALISGYNPIDGNLGKWDEGDNIFCSEDTNSKTRIDWNYIHALKLKDKE